MIIKITLFFTSSYKIFEVPGGRVIFDEGYCIYPEEKITISDTEIYDF